MGMRLRELMAQSKVRKLHKFLSARSRATTKTTTSSSRTSSGTLHHDDVPKGHFAVYVGGVDEATCKKRFVVPITYLKHPLFLGLLKLAEEEYGFHQPTGVLTIPCTHDYFISLTSTLDCS